MSNPRFLNKDDILKNIYLGCISSYVPHHYPRVKTQYHSVLRYQPFRPRTKTFKLINILNYLINYCIHKTLLKRI